MEELSENGVICPIPWIHLSLFPNGKTLLCPCQSDYTVTAGNYNDEKITDLINSKVLRDLRVDLLKGEKNKICNNCYDCETINPKGESPRTNYLKNFHTQMERGISNTNGEGFINTDKFEFSYWDVRLINLCNLKCRTCHPIFSSSILDEYKKNGIPVPKVGNNSERPDRSDILDDLIKHADVVQEIHFAGGEPLLMKEHWAILDELVKKKRFDVKLHYQTNLMKLDYKGVHVFEYWKKFKTKLVVSPSVDAYGDRLSYIRGNSDWNKLNSNLLDLIKFKQKYNNIEIIPTITISIFSVFYVFDLINYLSELEIKNYKLNFVLNPNYYNASLLPDSLKEIISERLIEFGNINPFILNQLEMIKNDLIRSTFTSRKQELLIQFRENVLKFDKIRNQDFIKFFPELKELVA
ncbi:MAG TPA: twitch domain-containing radical SAM protein [Ignavibacteria bacterium]|nr:twitch domain-containing radical SAM protein [Ignavibacteria bacterium]